MRYDPNDVALSWPGLPTEMELRWSLKLRKDLPDLPEPSKPVLGLEDAPVNDSHSSGGSEDGE